MCREKPEASTEQQGKKSLGLSEREERLLQSNDSLRKELEKQNELAEKAVSASKEISKDRAQLYFDRVRYSNAIQQHINSLSIVVGSKYYQISLALMLGLHELKSLNPVRIFKYLGALIAYMFGKKKYIQPYAQKDILAVTLEKMKNDIPIEFAISPYSLNTVDDFAYIDMDRPLADEVNRTLEEEREEGFPIIWMLAPMFRRSRLSDGYYRRIKAIDDIIGTSAHRIYLGSSPWHEQVKIEFTNDYRWEILYNHENEAHNDIVTRLKREMDIHYSHSVVQLSPILEEKHLGRLFIEMHGISPEENVMAGDLQEAEKSSVKEKFAAEKADTVVVVTSAMKDHYVKKYPGFRPKIITMPILAYDLNITADSLRRRKLLDGRAVVVYAGGLQAWQQIDVMQDAIERQRSQFVFKIFTNDPNLFLDQWGDRKPPPQMQVETKGVAALKEEYDTCHYGFVLRADSEVNRVSCPTKLVEYIEHGIVPILQSTHIGDFVSLGLRYIALEDFLNGDMPTEAERHKMAVSNLDVLHAINEMFVEGRAELRKALGIEE